MLIIDVYGRQILDSRGNPTVEVEVTTDTGATGRAAVPSGASTGKYEAVELRDNDAGIYMGKSVHKAIENVNTILSEALMGIDVQDQRAIDTIMIGMDGTSNKSKLGANAMLAVSLAAAKAGAEEAGLALYKYLGGVNAYTLPIPLMNILNGGSHADNNVDLQEFMIVPVGAETFPEALRMGVETFHHLKKLLKKGGYATNVGDEGGFAPSVSSNEAALEIVLHAIEEAGYKPGEDISIALDAAASEFYNEEEKVYHFKWSDNRKMSSSEMVGFWKEWVDKYPIVSIEDGLHEDDWTGWKELTSKVGNKTQIVGDDLFVTNVEKLKRGIEEKSANAILIKVNQIGTLTETVEAVQMADKAQFNSIISHRSGETEDTTIADLAVALNTGQIKTGSASRTDRIAKYNQLLRINEALGDSAYYPGKNYKFF